MAYQLPQRMQHHIPAKVGTCTNRGTQANGPSPLFAYIFSDISFNPNRTTNMKTSSFEILIDLNNRGVDLFASGNIDSASKHFRTALHMLKVVLKRTLAKAPCRSLTSDLLAASAETDASPQSIMPAQGVASLSSRLDLSSRLYVSTRPVKIVSKNLLNKEVRASFTTTAVSFNLALACQLMSLTCCTKTWRYRRSAIAFYGVAYNLRLKAAKRGNVPSGTMALLDLAIINNLAVLHHQIGNEGHARNCFERLVFQIHKLDDELATEATGFVTNLIVMGLSAGSLPAAASA